jgi:hypothetical protein
MNEAGRRSLQALSIVMLVMKAGGHVAAQSGEERRAGSVVPALSYIANRALYNRYLPEGTGAFNRIVWRDAKFFPQEC